MSMKPSIHNDQQLRLFPDSEELTVHSSKPLIVLPEYKQSKRTNHMIKFKSLHESQKPLIHLMPESYLEYIGGLIPSDHLCRISIFTNTNQENTKRKRTVIIIVILCIMPQTIVILALRGND